ncbi:MAG: hypothetical protein Ct9H90mP11_06410 [Acidimicrobiales bacterium]|nr:MAG: hypothetical protein Ct9H90mP11_06410 [Acidimicrobiales bacterium]
MVKSLNWLQALFGKESHQLLEKGATRIATEVLAIPAVTGVQVNLRKMRPPVPEFLESSAVKNLSSNKEY